MTSPPLSSTPGTLPGPLGTAPVHSPTEDARPREQGARVEVRALGKSFVHAGRRLDILKDINLDLAPGEMVSVVGASGVGKSTLLHILGTLDLPTTGQLMFDRKDVVQLSPSALADFRGRSIGFVFQFHH